VSNELLISKNAQQVNRKQEQCIKGTAPQNVTVVLPAYNEETSIGSIVLLARIYSDNVIVVNDGSSDRTSEIARKAGVDVITHNTRKGKTKALETGFKAASDLGADIIVTMDSDGQHNPADIPKLVEPILRGEAEMVNGSRYLNNLGKNAPFYRRIGKNILSSETKLSSGANITDSESGFRAFAASTKNIFHFNAPGSTIEREMLADAGNSGIRIKEVEIGSFYSFDDSPKNPIKYVVELLVKVMKDMDTNKPLYYYSVPGFALATVGFYMGFKFLQSFFLGIDSLHLGPALLMVFLSLAGAYMTIRGIVIHSLAGAATRQNEAD
jgi:glycosyltransferase involved in cell wall biosynthesis